MRITIINDDKYYVEPLMWELNEQGYEVIHCQSVDDVLDEEGKWRSPKPDFILLDIMIPHNNRYDKRETGGGNNAGLRLLEDIRKEDPDIPVVVITAYQHLNMNELKGKYGDSIKEILVKPVTSTRVIETLRKLFVKNND